MIEREDMFEGQMIAEISFNGIFLSVSNMGLITSEGTFMFWLLAGTERDLYSSKNLSWRRVKQRISK